MTDVVERTADRTVDLFAEQPAGRTPPDLLAALGQADPLPPATVAELVERHGLRRAGARTSLRDYSRDFWSRRHFVTTYARGMNEVGYNRSHLGQAWQLLTPLLNVAVYYLVFGVILHTKRGVPDFFGFLAVGIFTFGFVSASVNSGTRAIRSNLNLTRALRFPRAVLPAATTINAFLQLLYSAVIMVVIALIAGEVPTWRWLELVPTFVIMVPFCLGLAFVCARIGARIPDAAQLLPFLVRVWMYLSGIMWSIDVVARSHAAWVGDVMHANPAAVYVNLARHALIGGNPVMPHAWPIAIAWSIGACLLGYLWFWRGEEEYGNV